MPEFIERGPAVIGRAFFIGGRSAMHFGELHLFYFLDNI